MALYKKITVKIASKFRLFIPGFIFKGDIF